jgi:hypothetical protein
MPVDARQVDRRHRHGAADAAQRGRQAGRVADGAGLDTFIAKSSIAFWRGVMSALR